MGRLKKDEYTGIRVKKIAERTIRFEELLKTVHKESPIHENMQHDNWEKFKYMARGGVSIRCQARVDDKSKKGKPIQCLLSAMNNGLLCRRHGGKNGEAKAKRVKSIQQELGIYSGNGIKSLQTELREIEHLQPEQLQDTTEELKLSIALLRKYLKSADDEKIAKNPGQLLWMIGEIARLKKEYYEIKHTKNVSFTKEQVVFLFNQFYLILIKLIKDTDLLSEISFEVEKVGKLIGENGFKNLN